MSDARFIWRERDLTRYDDLGDALCSLKTVEDAAELRTAYIEFLSRPTANLGGKTPEEVAAANIDHLTGSPTTEGERA